MRTSWRIFRLFDIDIKIDSSWLLIAGIVTWALASRYFPEQYPNWSLGQYWLVGAVTSLFLFLSILAHELAHSLVARANGETVRSITLFVFGGVAEIADEPDTPAKELGISLAGPVSSLVIALIFTLIKKFLGSASESIDASVKYLAYINLFLALFNLVPGFPLDGGRILRAIIWKVTGNLKRATRIASTTGQIFAYFLIILGISQILGGLFFNGLWIALIGWFIHSAATRGYQQVLLKEMLMGVRVQDLMNENFVRVRPDISVQKLIEDFILKEKERVFLVTDNGQLSGIVCLEDVKTVPSEKRETTSVGEVMTSRDSLMAISPDDDGNEVLAKLASGHVNQLPVMEGGKVRGVVCRNDILDFLHLRTELGI
jgi:Zn-dependent protease